MPNNDYILRSDALKAILGVSIYDTIEELEGARTIAENTWADGLYDAYKIIEEEVDAAEVEPKQRWIPVTERLPEDDTIVLVVSLLHHKPYPAFQIGGVWYDSFLVACQIAIGMDDEETIDDSGITHWMPLPEPPKEEDNA